MKKVLTFISLILIIAACESIPPNPLYLDANGVTVKAHKWAKIGDEGIINEVRYTIVDIKILRDLIRSGNSYDRVCTSFIADMSSLFDFVNTSQDISNWDVSNVQNMNTMFRGASSFNQDLSSWDVNKVVFSFYSIRDFSDGTTNWTLPKPNF